MKIKKFFLPTIKCTYYLKSASGVHNSTASDGPILAKRYTW